MGLFNSKPKADAGIPFQPKGPDKPLMQPQPPATQPSSPPAIPLQAASPAEVKHEAKDAKPDAPDEMVTTGVDDLIKLLNEYPKLSVDEVSRRLNVSKAIIKSWIDFLVEERILGIEYSFTTPYIYLNRPTTEDKPKKVTEIRLSYALFRQEFYEKARADRIPEDKIPAFWEAHLRPLLDANKDFFLREIKKRNLPKGEELWQKYVQEALSA